ncbi:MAG: ATP-binding protein [Bacteroidota bacterium]
MRSDEGMDNSITYGSLCWRMKLYINRKVLWGLIISIAIILGLGILSYWAFLSLSAATQWANHARRVLQYVQEVRSTMVMLENSQRGFSLTHDSAFIKTYNKDKVVLSRFVSDLDSATIDNNVQQTNIDSLRTQIDHYVASGSNMQSVQKVLNDIREEEQSLILSRSLSVQTGFYRFVWAFVGLIVVTLGVLISLIWVINANTRSRTIAEDRLRDAELETQKINKDLESFSYSVSHDLRAPLRSINGYSQILVEDYSDKIDEEGNRILNVIINNAKKMGRLIDDLLEFSRLGRQEINRQLVDVDEQVKNISSELVEREQGRKIELSVQPLGFAAIDQAMMRQVWINLIGNAIKYSRNREVAKVEIGKIDRSDKGRVVFFVRDNGAGFDMAYIDKLFGVFQRLHKNNEFEGTGVGLALVKRIVDRHKGRIWAEAKVDGGATFYIELPVE